MCVYFFCLFSSAYLLLFPFRSFLEMMKGAGLNNFQQRQLKATMQGERQANAFLLPARARVCVEGAGAR